MATGIVSIGAELQAFHRVAVVLFVTHVIAFLVPLLLNLLRVFRRPAALLRMHGHSAPHQPMQQPRTGRLAPAATSRPCARLCVIKQPASPRSQPLPNLGFSPLLQNTGRTGPRVRIRFPPAASHTNPIIANSAGSDRHENFDARRGCRSDYQQTGGRPLPGLG
jgi:hypothetical protein